MLSKADNNISDPTLGKHEGHKSRESEKAFSSIGRQDLTLDLDYERPPSSLLTQLPETAGIKRTG
jgi:hypothetical protein